METNKCILPSIRPRTSLQNKSTLKDQFINHIYINIEEIKERLYDKPTKRTSPPSFPPPPLPPRASSKTTLSPLFNRKYRINCSPSFLSIWSKGHDESEDESENESKQQVVSSILCFIYF